MSRRVLPILGTMLVGVMLLGGVALADHLANTVQCPNTDYGWCDGTELSDHMYGTDAQDNIQAYTGDDQVDAYAGDDNVFGESGNDTLYGGEGADVLEGDPPLTPDIIGNDKLYGGAGQDEVNGYEGNDFLHGGSEKDFIRDGNGKDQIKAGDGSDTIETGYINRPSVTRPDGLVDTVDCGSGTDTVYFQKGSDKINANCEIKKPY